jgi:hypothetical protein
LSGQGAIRATFENMFANGSVQAHPERVHKIESLASAVHHLVERVEVVTPQGPKQAFVIATNVYHKTPQGWRMVAHHTSPGTPNDSADVGVKPQGSIERHAVQSARMAAGRTCPNDMAGPVCASEVLRSIVQSA